MWQACETYLTARTPVRRFAALYGAFACKMCKAGFWCVGSLCNPR